MFAKEHLNFSIGQAVFGQIIPDALCFSHFNERESTQGKRPARAVGAKIALCAIAGKARSGRPRPPAGGERGLWPHSPLLGKENTT